MPNSSHEAYDYAPFNATSAAQMYNSLYGPGNCVSQLQACHTFGTNSICSAADDFCYTEVEDLYDRYAHRDEYDIRELQPDPFPYDFYVAYLNTPAVQAAIGAYQNYSDSSSTVGTAFGTTGDDGREDSTVQDMLALVRQNVTVMMYTGDADYNCNWLGGEVVSNEIGAPGFSSAGYVNISTDDGIVHGQVKQSGGFSFVRIYESGHEVPFYQPVAALAIFERAIGGDDIATGTEKAMAAYKTVGPARSTYREGNATIQFSVLPSSATYNTTTDAPNPPMVMAKRNKARRVSSLSKPR